MDTVITPDSTLEKIKIEKGVLLQWFVHQTWQVV